MAKNAQPTLAELVQRAKEANMINGTKNPPTRTWKSKPVNSPEMLAKIEKNLDRGIETLDRIAAKDKANSELQAVVNVFAKPGAKTTRQAGQEQANLQKFAQQIRGKHTGAPEKAAWGITCQQPKAARFCINRYGYVTIKRHIALISIFSKKYLFDDNRVFQTVKVSHHPSSQSISKIQVAYCLDA